jgi:hypothetical protein
MQYTILYCENSIRVLRVWCVADAQRAVSEQKIVRVRGRPHTAEIGTHTLRVQKLNVKS